MKVGVDDDEVVHAALEDWPLMNDPQMVMKMMKEKEITDWW